MSRLVIECTGEKQARALAAWWEKYGASDCFHWMNDRGFEVPKIECVRVDDSERRATGGGSQS